MPNQSKTWSSSSAYWLLLFAVVLFVGRQIGCSRPPGSAPKSVPKIQILDYDGIQKLIASHPGKVVVMDAWSTSCAPCLKEFHNLVELHKEYGADRIACVSLSFDFEGIAGETPASAQAKVIGFLTSQGALFENIISSEDSDTLYKKFKLGAIPAVFVYDKKGQLRKRFDNEKSTSEADQFTYADVRKVVAELMAEE